MNKTDSLLTSMKESLAGVTSQVIEHLPRIIAAIALLIVGWLLAKLIKSLIIRLITRLDVFWQKLVARKGIGQLQSRNPPARFVGELVFWLIILIVVALASEILGLGIFVNWLSKIVIYVPLLISGMLIILAGFIVSSLARDVTSSALSSAGLSQSDLIGRTVQIIILFTAIVIGADQVGVDVTFLSTIASVVLAATLGGVAIAFGIGARSHVANLVAAHHFKEVFKPGDQICIREICGVIVEITVTQVILESETGQHYLPAAILNDEIVRQIPADV